MSECIRIPARARIVPQSATEALKAKFAAQRDWMREQERKRQAYRARLKAAREAAAESFFKSAPANVTPIGVRR